LTNELEKIFGFESKMNFHQKGEMRDETNPNERQPNWEITDIFLTNGEVKA